MGSGLENTRRTLNEGFQGAFSTGKALDASSWHNGHLRGIPRKHDRLVILGNGPSLASVLESKREFLQDKDLMCVNFFADSDTYADLKPAHYIATDPIVFQNPEQSDRLFGALAEKTDWELRFFAPWRYRNETAWQERLHANPLIRLHFINTTPAEGSDAWCFPLYRRMLAMPRPRNVLIPALMTALWMGYPTIYTAGVEHSWHRQLWVNDDNVLMINDTHFYDAGTPQNRRHGDFTVGSLFRSLAIAFDGYHAVERYARQQGSRIYNITEGSFIDAFERKKI